MWRTLQDRLLLVVVALLVLLVGLFALLPFFHQSDRRIGIIFGEMTLVDACRDYTNSGALTNYTGPEQVWLSSNAVTIGGTQYQCFLELRSERFSGDGTLAMTTNRTFIWLDRSGPPKIIGPGYRPPLSGY